MLHQMKLHTDPFERIRSGKKTLELRLYDEKRQKIKLGDEIEFLKRSDLSEKIKVRVVALFLYETFNKMMDDLPASFLGYEEKDKSSFKDSMYEYYSKEEERGLGVVGIRFEIV